MCECVFVGVFCMWVMATICSRKVLYEWCVIGRYKIVNYVMLTFSGFFHYVSSMHVNNRNLVTFNFMYRGFLDLVWLWCLIICVLEHEFVNFNKPYLWVCVCVFFFFFLLVAEWCWRLWVCLVCFKRILFCLELWF